jgi:hypothetical protein
VLLQVFIIGLFGVVTSRLASAAETAPAGNSVYSPHQRVLLCCVQLFIAVEFMCETFSAS